MKSKIVLAIVLLVLVGGNVYFYSAWEQQKLETEKVSGEYQNKLDTAGHELSETKESYESRLKDLQQKYDELSGKSSSAEGSKNKFGNEVVSKNNNDYKIVKLTNQEFYYGILTGYKSGTVTLTDIYYTQGFVDPNKNTGANPPQLSLVKRGGELGGAEDKMLLPDSQIISIETLNVESRIYQAIQEYKKFTPPN